jgi:long-chain acyl-CoA synthetase
MLKLKDDCKLVKPTVFIAVPRIYNKIVDKVKDQFNEKTGIAKCLVDSAVNNKFKNVEKDGSLNAGLYDVAVFNKVKEAFGGRIKKMVSGSAPLSK